VLVLEYVPNREICLPELLFSEVVPTRDPRLSIVCPESSIYFSMVEAFAKGIPPEDWYESSPDEADWITRSNKLLIHLPVNYLYRPENRESMDPSSRPEHVAVGMEHAAKKDAVVSAADRHSAVERPELGDMDSDDERISRVIQSCMEPLAINVKTEQLDEDLGQPNVDSPTVRSTMAMTEGKAQRLLKLKQSGISPEMLRRRLQKIEEKLSALRSQSKTSMDDSQSGVSSNASESRSVRQNVSRPIDENVPQKQSDIPTSAMSRVEMARRYAERHDELCRTAESSSYSQQSKKPQTFSEDVAVGRVNSLDDVGHKHLSSDTASAVTHKVPSELLSRNSGHSEQLSGSSKNSEAFLPPRQNSVSDLRQPQLLHEPACNPPDAGNQMDDLPWYVGYLSLDTKWDSQFIESQPVQRTLLEAMRNWRLRKPLDLIMSGQLRDVPLDWTPMATTWKTDHTVDCCWNSVLWYFGALLGEPADPCSQQSMSEGDGGSNSVDALPDDGDDDWWGIAIDKSRQPAIDPIQDRQKTVKSQTSLIPSEMQDAPLTGLDAPKSSQPDVEPALEKTILNPTAVVVSVISPSDKLISVPTVDSARKSPLRSGGSHKEKSEHSEGGKFSESSSHGGDGKPSSEKRKRKHEDRKKSKHSKLGADGSSTSVRSVEDSEEIKRDTKKEGKRTSNDRETEKHSKKMKKRRRDMGDGEDEDKAKKHHRWDTNDDDDAEVKTKKRIESSESGRGTDISDLLHLFVGSDEKKLSLLSKAIRSAKQFNSHKLTTATSLHWAVALALLDENVSDKEAGLPASLWSMSEQHPDLSAEQLLANKSIATESSVKRIFDSVSDFMNAILSGKSASDVSDTKSGAANGLSASHLDELHFSESDSGTGSSPTDLKAPVVPKVKVEVENSVADGKNCTGPKVGPVLTTTDKTDDVIVVEEMKKIKVGRRSVGDQKSVLPETNTNRKIVLTKQSGSDDLEKMRVELQQEEKEQKAGDGVGKENRAESDVDEASTAKQLQKWSSIVEKALISLRDEHSRLEDAKEVLHHHHHHHHREKETSGHVDKGTVDSSSTPRQSDTKTRHSSDHTSQQEKSSKHSRHEKKNRSHHDHHKKSSRSEKESVRDRPITSSYEVISDTELEGQTSSVSSDIASHSSKQHSRNSRNITGADDKAKTSDGRSDSAKSRSDKTARKVAAGSDDKTLSVVPTEKPSVVLTEKPPVSAAPASQPAVTSSSTSTTSHIPFCRTNIFKMASSVTAPPVKTATTDMFLASRGPRFMQTFRRSQIAKRRIQRESQQTATGGKLLTPPHRSPNSMVMSKPVVRPIGLSLEATLAALSTSTPTSQSDISTPQLHSSTTDDSTTVVSLSSNMMSPIPTVSTVYPLLEAKSVDAQKSPLRADSTDGTTVDFQSQPPLPASPNAAGVDSAPPLPEDDPCDSRTTSVAGSPPPDMSLLCGDTLSTPAEHQIPVLDTSISIADAASTYASVYPTMPAYGNLSLAGSAMEQYFGPTDYGCAYWMGGYMPSYGAYGYESSMYSSAYAWYYGQAWNPVQQPSMIPASLPAAIPTSDSVPLSTDVLPSCDGGYGSYPSVMPVPVAQSPDISFSPAQQELANPWSAFSSSNYGPDPQFLNSVPQQIPITTRLRAPPRLSLSDDESPRPQKSPLLPLPVQTLTDFIPPLIPPEYLARFLSSGDESTEGRPVIGPQKKRFFVYTDNTQLKAEVTVSYLFIIMHEMESNKK